MAGTQVTRFVFSRNDAVYQVLVFLRKENLCLAGNETMDRNCILANDKIEIPTLFHTQTSVGRQFSDMTAPIPDVEWMEMRGIYNYEGWNFNNGNTAVETPCNGTK
jgi:hypothetical protein